MAKEISTLKNKIEYIYKKNDNTPRMALCFNLSVNEPEKIPGVYVLMARLLLQGTKNYSSEELANEFEKYAVTVEDISIPEQAKIVALGEATHGNQEFQQLFVLGAGTSSKVDL